MWSGFKAKLWQFRRHTQVLSIKQQHSLELLGFGAHSAKGRWARPGEERPETLQFRVMLLKAQSISAQRPETRVCVTEKTNVETSEAKSAYSREEMQELGFGGACIAKEQSLDCTKDKCWEMSQSPACLRCLAHKQPWLSEPQTTDAFPNRWMKWEQPLSPISHPAQLSSAEFVIITQALYPLQAEALFLLFPSRQLGSEAAQPTLVLKTWNMDLAHGNMERTQDPLFVSKLQAARLPSWLPSPAQKQNWNSHSIIYWLQKLEL